MEGENTCHDDDSMVYDGQGKHNTYNIYAKNILKCPLYTYLKFMNFVDLLFVINIISNNINYNFRTS